MKTIIVDKQHRTKVDLFKEQLKRIESLLYDEHSLMLSCRGLDDWLFVCSQPICQWTDRLTVGSNKLLHMLVEVFCCLAAH